MTRIDDNRPVVDGYIQTSAVERSPLVEKVVSAITEYISASNLKAGSKLPSEIRLASMFGVSRLALREALIRLKALGLIEARHGAGWFFRRFEPADSFRQLSPLLKHFTGADIHQIMQVRMILEPGIAEIASQHVSAEGLTKLKTSLEHMETHLRDREKFIEWDMNFHATLATEGGNTILTVMCAMLTDLSNSAQWAYRDSADNRRRSLEYHREIYGGIAQQDKRRAKQAMIEHLQDVWSRIDIEDTQ